MTRKDGAYAKERAKKLLIHYFELLAKKTNVVLDFDNVDEIGEIIDDIIDAAVSESVKIVADAMRKVANERKVGESGCLKKSKPPLPK
jgi:hypothetical protein